MNSDLISHLRPLQPDILARLRAWVEQESPSADHARLESLAVTIADHFARLGARVSRIETSPSPAAVLARFDFHHSPDTTVAPLLLLGHFDTVWPVGTLATMPFRVDETAGAAHGPGTYDMKASLVQIEFAIRTLADLGLTPARPIEVLYTSDEEIGSPGSRPVIEQAARRAAAVLVLEPPLANDGLKTARKGIGRFRLDIQGLAAHAGVEPEKGASAVVELAHQVLAIQRLANPSTGTTLNVGRVEGGTTPNVVAAQAWADIDVRVTSAAEAARVESALHALQPVDPRTQLAVSGRFNRPPMERTAAVAWLAARAQAVATSLGLPPLAEGSTGGGSDANFTAALGVPTLDGLGTPGAGAHASHEHIRIEALPERAALLAALLIDLSGTEIPR